VSDDNACRGRAGEAGRVRQKASASPPKRRSEIRPAAGPAPSFAEVQSLFQRAVLDGDQTVLDLIADSSRTDRETLLGVYRHAYRARLVEILRNDYAELAAVAGDALFETLAQSYVSAHPSRTANARWFGAAFPELVAGHASAATRPELADIARFTRALSDAFDAADATRLTLDHLASVSAYDWGGLVFSPHPSVRRLDLSTNAVALWRWASDGADASARPEVLRLSEPDQLAVYRPELTPRYRRLGYEEAMMLDEMIKGTTFAGLCEMVGTYGGEDGAALRAASHLKLWIVEGMLSGPETD
jgi:hypothetical protein